MILRSFWIILVQAAILLTPGSLNWLYLHLFQPINIRMIHHLPSSLFHWPSLHEIVEVCQVRTCSIPYLNCLISEGLDITIISEHWLLPFDLHRLNEIHSDYRGRGQSDSRLSYQSLWGEGPWRHRYHLETWFRRLRGTFYNVWSYLQYPTKGGLLRINLDCDRGLSSMSKSWYWVILQLFDRVGTTCLRIKTTWPNCGHGWF